MADHRALNEHLHELEVLLRQRAVQLPQGRDGRRVVLDLVHRGSRGSFAALNFEHAGPET